MGFPRTGRLADEEDEVAAGSSRTGCLPALDDEDAAGSTRAGCLLDEVDEGAGCLLDDDDEAALGSSRAGCLLDDEDEGAGVLEVCVDLEVLSTALSLDGARPGAGVGIVVETGKTKRPDVSIWSSRSVWMWITY